MKVKKDPTMRREAFIKAATELFVEKGYDAVSIRAVLDAVGDKTASPSVFYYYFPSKEALYRTCVRTVAKSYLSGLREGFSSDCKSLEERLVLLVSRMETSMREDRQLLLTGKSVPNRLFILDMREQVTSEAAEMWSDYFYRTGLYSGSEAQILAQFLSGGIGEIVYRYMLETDRSEEEAYTVMDAVVGFVPTVIGFSDEERRRLFRAWRKHREEERDGCTD